MGRSESESSINDLVYAEKKGNDTQVNERSIEHEIKLKLSQFAAFCSILMDLFLTFDVKT